RTFNDQCYELGRGIGDFDWREWIASPEGRQLYSSRQALANASPEQVAKLLTALVRQERFSEGALGEAHKSGLLSALLERVAAIAVGVSEYGAQRRRKYVGGRSRSRPAYSPGPYSP